MDHSKEKAPLRVLCSVLLKEHGALKCGLAKFLGDLHGSAEPTRVDTRLRGLFDDAADLDGQLRRSVKDEYAMVRQ
jgi:hypothetical protein